MAAFPARCLVSTEEKADGRWRSYGDRLGVRGHQAKAEHGGRVASGVTDSRCSQAPEGSRERPGSPAP